MRLRKVRLQNYRNHTDTELALEGVTFALIRGANASGKSSIGQAISVNLCDTTMGLGADGAGFRSKIKDGEKQAIITTEIQGQHILEKKVSLNLSATGRVSAVKCLDAPDDSKVVKGFENFLARYSDALKIALNTDAFTKLGDKEQKALLAKLVLPSRYDFPQDKIETANSFLDMPIDFNGEPFAVIEKAYKLLYKERESCNRQVKEFDIPESLPIPKGIDSVSLQKELTGIRAQREKLQKERDESVAKANETEVERGKIQTKIEHLQAEVKKGSDRLKVLANDILPEDGVAALQKVAAKAEELAKLQEEHDGLLGAIRTADAQIERLGEVLDTGAVCPTCDQEINGEKITGLIAALQKETVTADARLQALDKQIESIGDIGAAKASLKAHEDALKEKATIEESITKTVTIGKETRTALNALGEKKDATLQFNDPLGTLQAKEDKIIEQLTPMITAEQRAKDIEAKRAQLEKLEAKAKTLDELTKWFDKDGIKAKLIAEHIGSFENRIQSVLSRFGYKAMLGADMEFKVETRRGYTGPVVELSKAERQLFYPAFQCAVSIAAGIKMVVIDDMDTYLKDDGLRNEMYISVYGLVADGSLDQAILIEASTDKAVPEKKAAGAKYFFVTDGQVEVLG